MCNKSMRFGVEQMLEYSGDEDMGCIKDKNEDLFHLSRKNFSICLVCELAFEAV